MNMNNYTIKSQEAVQTAVQLAQEKGHGMELLSVSSILTQKEIL